MAEHTPRGARVRQAAMPWLFVALAAVVVLAGWRPGRRGGVVASGPAALPVGAWRTFASGDDVLALGVESGTLWAGTRGGGLVRWDTTTGGYTQYLRPQDPLGGNTVYDIAIDARGRKWLATSGGLTVLDDRGTADLADDVWRTYLRSNTHGGLPSDDVRAVVVDGDRVWVGGVQSWDPTKEEWAGGGLGRLDTRGTPETSDDVWAAVATFESTYRKQLDGTVRLGLVSDNINDLLLLPNGNLWIATSRHWRLERSADPDAARRWTQVHGGLSYLETKGTADTADDSWTAMSCDEMQFAVKCPVRTLALDRHGWVWAAIAGRGVTTFVGDQGRFTDEQWRIYNPFGLEGAFVQSIAFGPVETPVLANTVWLATTRGLAVIDHRGTLRNQADDQLHLGRGSAFTTADGLARDRTQALALVGDRLYVGTGPQSGVGGGISPLSLGDLKVAPAWRTTNAPPTNFITDLAFGAPGSRWAGHVWIATGSRSERLFGAGVVDLDTKGTTSTADDVWTRHTTLTSDADQKPPWTGLRGDNVHAVAVQGDRVWFGSTEATWNRTSGKYDDGGLAVFDGTSWTARTPENTGAPASGLRHGSVSALAVGCEGELWVGTGNPWDETGAGVDVLTPGGSVHVLSQDRWASHSYAQLASNNTTAIAVDCQGRRVYVGSEHHVAAPNGGSPGGSWVGGGVAVRDLDAGTWIRYDTRNGLQSFKAGAVLAEVKAVAAGLSGSAYVGSYGTTSMTAGELVSRKPNWPAVVNIWNGSEWSHQVFGEAGWVSDIAVDAEARVWVGTSRGGAAWDSAPPERWLSDRARGGLMVYDEGSWQRLDMAGAGLPANDISAVAVSPEGHIWIATEGWGLARFVPGEAPPTPAATSDAPSPTVTLTPTEEPTLTPRPSATKTPSPRPSATAVPGARGRALLPLAFRAGGVEAVPTATRSAQELRYRAYLPFGNQAAR